MIKGINKWNKIGEIRWLTSWDEFAVSDLSPAVGLDKFNLARNREDNIGKLDSAIKVANEVGDDRLIIWIDDDLNELINCDENDYFKKRLNTLLLRPNYGLKPEHIKLVDDFLVNQSLWMGKNVKEFEKYL
jgi:hypothetical protein